MAQIPSPITAGDALWEKIDEQTLSVAAATVTFSGIETTFTFLRVTMWSVQDGTGGVHTLQLNSDGGANYDQQLVKGNGAVVTGTRQTGLTQFSLSQTNVPANEEGQHVIMIAKPVAGEEAQIISANGNAGTIVLDLFGGQWNNTAALINRIDIATSGGNLDADTRILLEGAEPAAA